ncbi:MAG: YfhO family protein [Chloroflexi bacterium]|nr:YfhO family protein [Chloroflexota bacterium]
MTVQASGHTGACRWQRTGWHAAALAVLLLAVLCYFRQLLFPGPWQRQYIADSDFSQQFFPFQRFIANEWQHGRLPVWNPYTFGGYPQLADPQSGVFYPLNVVFNLLIARPDLTYMQLEWRAVVSYFLGGVFAYLLFLRMSQSVPGALLGALAWTLGGFLTSYPLPQLPILETVIWLPLVLLAVDVTLSRSPWNVAAASLAGVAGGCMVLAGHAQTVLLGGYATFGYALIRLPRRKGSTLPALGRLVLAGVIAGSIAGMQVLPSWFFLQESTREHLSYAAASGGYQWSDFGGLLLPGGIFQRTFYIGVLPLVCAALAMRRRAAWPWLTIGGIAAVVALGGHTPLFAVLYRLAPGFASFRDQERAAFVTALALAALAALGASEVFSRAKRDTHGIDFVLALLLVIIPSSVAAALLFPRGSTPFSSVQAMPLGLNLITAALLLASSGMLVALTVSHRLSRAVAIASAVFVTVVNLQAAGAQLSRSPVVPAPQNSVASALRWIRQQQGVYRVGNSSDGAINHNTNLLYGVAGTMGDSPIELLRSAKLLGASNGYLIDQLMAVRYVVSHQKLGTGFRLVRRSGDVSVYALTYGLPPAWAVDSVEMAGSMQEALTKTLALTQPGALAIVEGMRPLSSVSTPLVQREAWTAWTGDAVAGTVSVSVPALLVVSLPYSRGWTAEVDGRRVHTYPVDTALIGIRLARGRHTIALRYHQRGLRRGLLSGGGGIALSIVVMVVGVRRVRRTG